MSHSTCNGNETYYTTLQEDIKNSASLLPLTVSGDVGWVVAQTDELHLRLTLIDGAWLNPSDKTATITFHSASPSQMKDLLDGTNFSLANPNAIEVTVPCGMFRFIDITLSEPLAFKERGQNEEEEEEENPEFEPIAFNIFPNPASNLLNIEFAATGLRAQFQLVDILGRVVADKTASTISGTNYRMEFDLEGVPSGAYVVRWVEKGEVKRFIYAFFLYIFAILKPTLIEGVHLENYAYKLVLIFQYMILLMVYFYSRNSLLQC